jgi:hypothetical protein
METTNQKLSKYDIDDQAFREFENRFLANLAHDEGTLNRLNQRTFIRPSKDDPPPVQQVQPPVQQVPVPQTRQQRSNAVSEGSTKTAQNKPQDQQKPLPVTVGGSVANALGSLKLAEQIIEEDKIAKRAEKKIPGRLSQEEKEKAKDLFYRQQKANKAKDDIDGYAKKYGRLAELPGQTDYGVTKAIRAGLSKNAQYSDDIGSASGQIATCTVSLAEDLAKAVAAFSDLDKVSEDEKDQRVKEGIEALAHIFGDLLGMGKGAVNVANAAEQSHLSGAAQAVPGLGLAIAVPVALEDAYDLITTGLRWLDQRQLHRAIKQDLNTENDPRLEVTDNALKTLMHNDQRNMQRGLGKVAMDLFNIAGNITSIATAASLFGIGAGVIVSMAGTAGKLLIQADEKGEQLLDAHHANEARKDLDKIDDKDSQEATKQGLKLLKHDPRVAAQVLIDFACEDARKEGLDDEARANLPTSKILKYFDVKADLGATGEDSRDETAVKQDILRKMLAQLNVADETPETLTQQIKGYGEKVKNYVPKGKAQTVGNLATVKNILGYDDEEDRGGGYNVRKVLFATDVNQERDDLLKVAEVAMKQKKITKAEYDVVQRLLNRDERGKLVAKVEETLWLLEEDEYVGAEAIQLMEAANSYKEEKLSGLKDIVHKAKGLPKKAMKEREKAIEEAEKAYKGKLGKQGFKLWKKVELNLLELWNDAMDNGNSEVSAGAMKLYNELQEWDKEDIKVVMEMVPEVRALQEKAEKAKKAKK